MTSDLAVSTPRRAAITARFCSTALVTHSSSLAGCGWSSGMSSAGFASVSYTSPVNSRSSSWVLASARFAAMTPAVALSNAAFDSCTSVIAIRPTSKRFSDCSSWRLKACRVASAADSVSSAASTSKYRRETRTMRSCCAAR